METMLDVGVTVVGWRREIFNVLLVDAKGVVHIERRVL
jgi:hypothetical protein